MKKILGLAAGVALAGMVSSASATAVTLDYLGRGNGLLGEVTVTPDALPDGTQTNLLAGSLRMQRGQMGFLAWCFQFARQIEKTANYMINPNALDSRRRDDLSRLATGFLGMTTGDDANSAAFQLAIWEIVEETDTDDATGSILYDLAGGDFQAMATNNDNVVETANRWLGSLGGIRADAQITYLTSGASQDILTIAPIPLPASILLLGAGIGALVVVRRRGKPAAEA
jgi:hypothetical protein